MQDIHSMGGGGGSLFGGGGDRRLRPHHHQAAAAAAATALKCPRCDSLNTKFCYYNNYNLSQPRHFCKSCRRYWTKGGVLRNVPVGGGCRKTKRSNKPKTTPSADSPTAKRSSPNSSSENSIIGGTTAAHSSSENSITRATTEAASAPLHVMPNPSVEATGFLEQDSAVCGVFGEMGNFTSLMGSGDDQGIGIGIGFGFGQQAEGQWRGDEKIMVDQTVGVEVEVGVGGYGPSDWQSGGGDQGLFDLTDTVDHAYWSQTGDHQWSDQVHVQDQQHHHPTDLYNFP